jgi:hypothetical protein
MKIVLFKNYRAELWIQPGIYFTEIRGLNFENDRYEEIKKEREEQKEKGSDEEKKRKKKKVVFIKYAIQYQIYN